MSQSVQKSAISILDEFCKRKVQPPAVYTFTSDDGAAGFVCAVKAFNETSRGKDKSKKKAKHEAAQNLIKHLRELESFKFDLVFLTLPPNPPDESKVSSSTVNEKKRKAMTTTKSEPEINYVGKLLEYCTKNKLPPASFEQIENTPNPPNKIEFWMKCTVNDVVKKGNGANKKQAKQTAAMEVLQVLMAGQVTPNDGAKCDEPSPKQLKATDKSQDEDTSSTTNENIVAAKCNEPSPKQLKATDKSQDEDTSSTTSENIVPMVENKDDERKQKGDSDESN